MLRLRIVAVCVLTLVSGALAWGQDASISGTVQDTSSAAITEATVTVTNLATRTAREVSTNGTGFYRWF
jgi:Carboxypeptidase regulatory-like domain